MTTLTTTVTFLEMSEEPILRIQAPSRLKLMLARAEQPEVGFYRYLYDAVGGTIHWVDRKRMSDDELGRDHPR